MIIDAAPVTMGPWRGLDLNSGHTQDPTQATHPAMVRVLLFMIHKCWSRSSLGPGPALTGRWAEPILSGRALRSG